MTAALAGGSLEAGAVVRAYPEHPPPGHTGGEASALQGGFWPACRRTPAACSGDA